MRHAIHTNQAPEAIGAYSQAIKIGNTVYLAGQIPLNPSTMTMVAGGIKAEAEQVFENIQAVVQAAGGSMNQIVKFNIYLMNLSDITVVNDVIEKYCAQPYPARTSVQVAGLPKGALIEVEAILSLE